MLLLNAIKLRDINEPCKLIGPTIKNARKHRFKVDGSQICLDLPRYNSTLKYPVARNPKKDYKQENYRLKNTIPSKNDWGCLICAARAWDFYGPLFTGKLGTVTMVATIDSPRYLKPNTSLFHPRVFEQSVGEYITLLRSDDIDPRGQNWLAPSNWVPITTLEAVCCKFDVIPAHGRRHLEKWLTLPISDNKLLSLSFNLSWSYVDLEALSTNRDNIEHHDISAMEQLCDDIMNSLEVRLSDRALAQQKAALEGLDDTSLVKEYPPLKWEGPKELI
ncbi:hypothetical protein [Saccharophagus degradans]|nr:hypothetical protein [Saccharophagus degradans]MDO6606021.1 hypothetical protein [Saccharophagus degradans]